MKRYDLATDTKGQFPYSQAVREGDLIFVAGQLASDDPDWPGTTGDIEAETRAALDRISAILTTAEASMSDILKVSIFMTDLSLFSRMNAVYVTYFPDGLPARTTVGVASLLGDGLIEIDCIARTR